MRLWSGEHPVSYYRSDLGIQHRLSQTATNEWIPWTRDGICWRKEGNLFIRKFVHIYPVESSLLCARQRKHCFRLIVMRKSSVAYSCLSESRHPMVPLSAYFRHAGMPKRLCENADPLLIRQFTVLAPPGKLEFWWWTGDGEARWYAQLSKYVYKYVYTNINWHGSSRIQCTSQDRVWP